MRRRLPALVAAALVAALVAAWVRGANGVRIAALPEDGGGAAWFAGDPDTLYHARRLERALAEGGAVAVRDPLLAWPEYADGHADGGGAPIPWPGTYTRLLVALTGAGAPEAGPARERYVEQAVASWPLRLGALTAALVALAAGLVGGTLAALAAGLYQASVFAAWRYGMLGIGDHHAWVSLLHAAWMTLAGRALVGGRLDRPRAAAAHGAGAGVLAGAALGSWVASLMLVVLFQALLGGRIWAHGRRPQRGLAAFGLAFHGAAAVVLLPEVAVSPWGPFEVVNLSWFHLLELGLGGLVFVPLLVLPPAGPAARRYPWLVAGTLVALGLAATLGPWGRGLGEAFAWAGRSNPFMGRVTESQPLAWGQAGGLAALLKWCGAGVLLLPLAGWAARREPALWPWLAAAPALLVLALVQRRFAELLAPSAAVLLGCGLARLAAAPRGRRLSPLAWTALAVALPLAANPQGPRLAWNRTRLGVRYLETPPLALERAQRGMARWLREHAPPGGEGAVLAQWDQGHLLEWVARRPTVATNFGSYLGEASFLAPWRFLMAADAGLAERLLEGRRVRYVWLGVDWERNLDSMQRASAGDPGTDPERPFVRRLLPRGHPGRDEDADDPGFLRLVHTAPVRTPGREGGPPAGWVYERVAGARLEGRGRPGEELVAELELAYPGASAPLRWAARARVGDDGRVALRVPYTTEANNGDGAGVGPLRWRLGGRAGSLAVPEAAVLAGKALVLP